jgi:hypothetical protein
MNSRFKAIIGAGTLTVILGATQVSALTVGSISTWVGGPPLGGWVIDTATYDVGKTIEVALRAQKYPTGLWADPVLDSVSGLYTYTVDQGYGAANKALWDFDYSVIPSDLTLAYTMTLVIDADPSLGTSLNKIFVWNNKSGIIQGEKNLEDDNLENKIPITDFNPGLEGWYDFTLTVNAKDSSGNTVVSESTMRVHVVPEAGATVALLGIALAGLFGFRRKA